MPSGKQQGFAPLLTVLAIGVFGLLAVASLIPVNRNYNDGKADVAGVSLAKGDDNSKVSPKPAAVETKITKQEEVELEKEDVKIATAGGQTALVNKRVGALSTFPLSVNPTAKQLTVTTPAGSKVVTVLPQKAIDNMLAAHVMDNVTSEKAENSLASVPDLVNMEVENGVLGYRVKGNKIHKLLGFIPIKTGVEAFVSAENGQVVTSTDSLLGRILNKIAP